MNSRLLILIIFLLKSYIGTAQNSMSEADSIITGDAVSNSIKAKLSSPYSAGSLSNFFSNISVSSFFKEGVNGKIELQGKFGSRWSGGVSIDQKIGQSAEVATPLSLSGISPGTTVEFNLQNMFWHPSFNRTDNQVQKLNDVAVAYAKRNNIEDPHTVGLREINLNGTEEEKKQALAAFNTVSGSNPVFINAKVGFTKTSFSYTTDSFTLESNSAAFITPTFTLSLIKTLGNSFNVTGYIALSYNYSESYIPGDDITFSIPFGTTSNYYLNTLTFGKPEKATSNNITAEYRRNIGIGNPKGKFSSLAISPSVVLGIDSKMLGIILPVYFIKGADDNGKLLDGLQGGVRFGYITSTRSGEVSSFKDGFTAQLIISAPLNFLNNL
jgi:hypothetical protein